MSQKIKPTRTPFDLVYFQSLVPTWAEDVHFSHSIGSTNQEARRQLRQNLPSKPILLLTDQQMAGRGRLGRSWQAPAYSSLLFTLAFRLELPLSQAFLYGAALSLAIKSAVTETTAIGLDLKWPNDLLWEGRKVAGILAELESGLGPAKNQTWLVLGCGLNFDIEAAEFATARLESKAVALFSQAAAMEKISREQLLAAILNQWQNYQTRLNQDPSVIRKEWESQLITIGNWVEVWQNEKVVAAGTAIGLNEDGALVVREATGVQSNWAAGDVSVRLPNGQYSA